MTAPTPPTPPSPSGDADEPRFERLLTDLEDVVGRLERGELPLDEALAAFERGMTLAKRAGALLDAAEARVDQLLEERDGSTREVPFGDR